MAHWTRMVSKEVIKTELIQGQEGKQTGVNKAFSMIFSPAGGQISKLRDVPSVFIFLICAGMSIMRTK